jgi:uncharacterized membrane protein
MKWAGQIKCYVVLSIIAVFPDFLDTLYVNVYLFYMFIVLCNNVVNFGIN